LTSSVSILINRSLTKEFVPSKSLRQGDPMAPFSFHTIVESLAGWVRQAIKKNLYCVEMGANETKMGLLQFSHDTLFMCDASIQNVWVIKGILRSF